MAKFHVLTRITNIPQHSTIKYPSPVDKLISRYMMFVQNVDLLMTEINLKTTNRCAGWSECTIVAC